MTMTAIVQDRTPQPFLHSHLPAMVRVAVFTDIDAARADWHLLQASPHVSTPFQRFAFLAAWHSNVGMHQAEQPLIVVGYDCDNNPLVLLPFAVQREMGFRIVRFMGGEHTTFNMGLWRSDFLLALGPSDIDTLLEATRTHAAADVLALTRQPQHWDGTPNPLLTLPIQRAVNSCPVMYFDPKGDASIRISNSLRRRLRGKERKLQRLPGYRYSIASTDNDVTRLLDTFFEVKPIRMAALRLPNVFSDARLRAFIRDICAQRFSDGRRLVVIHALQSDGEMIAMFAGVEDGARFSMMFNTYTISENARHSPGLILMRHIVDHYASLGYSSIDFGIGADSYKRLFCKSDEKLSDAFMPLSMAGRAVAMAMATYAAGKRTIKDTPILRRFAQRVRATLET